MTNLGKEWESIDKCLGQKPHIIASNARKITDAYFRDFKPSLFSM
jgi:hypothetical protein